MPNFFFDIQIANLTVVDEEGVELSDRETAEIEARAAALDQARRRLNFGESLEVTVTVRDEASIVFKATAQATCRLL